MQRKRDRDERHHLDVEVKRLETEQGTHKKNLEEEFAYRPPKNVVPIAQTRGKPGLVPAADPQEQKFHVPSEALPRVGKLYKHQDNRYLAIKDWHMLSEGEREANRLKAELVADLESSP